MGHEIFCCIVVIKVSTREEACADVHIGYRQIACYHAETGLRHMQYTYRFLAKPRQIHKNRLFHQECVVLLVHLECKSAARIP